MDDGRTCRACGSTTCSPPAPRRARGPCAATAAGAGRRRRRRRGRPLACPGCPRRGRLRVVPHLARRVDDPPARAEPTARPVLIRPLLYGDRFELAAAFAGLSPRSRRHRFFRAPDELDGDELEHLTNIDYRDHFACVAVLEDGPMPHGVGVARYVRDGRTRRSPRWPSPSLDDLPAPGDRHAAHAALGERCQRERDPQLRQLRALGQHRGHRPARRRRRCTRRNPGWPGSSSPCPPGRHGAGLAPAPGHRPLRRQVPGPGPARRSVPRWGRRAARTRAAALAGRGCCRSG